MCDVPMNPIKYLLEAWREYPGLQARYNRLFMDYETIKIQLSQANDNIEAVEEKLSKLKSQVENKLEAETWEKYWTDKHPKKNISYLRHETDGDYTIDVRSFFMPDFNYPTFSIPKETTFVHDEVALSCLIFVMEKIVYASDMVVFGYDEYWSYGYQTIKRKRGDCDSGAILLANIMIHNGIPSWRVRLNAGYVKEPNTENTVGHAYVTYCRETDNQWVVLDWCYYQTYVKIADRPLHKDQRDYYDIWWSTTKEQSYGNKKYMKGMLEVFEVK